jgi:hypothetical protein
LCAAPFASLLARGVKAWLQVVSTRDPLCATMPDAAF